MDMAFLHTHHFSLVVDVTRRESVWRQIRGAFCISIIQKDWSLKVDQYRTVSTA